MSASFRREAFSFFTHLGGALAAVVALVFLVVRAETTRATVAFAIYGVTLTAMFVSSTLHHVGHQERGLTRRIDMSAIYLFIAGTYTPVCILAFPPAWGWPIAGLVWTLSVAGIVALFVAPSTPRRWTAALYLALGWISLVGIVPLLQTIPWQGVALLVGGGVVYSIGAVVYARKWPDPWPATVGYHGLWHVFVLVAAALHFLLIARYVPTA